jgi:hypothetical protein
VELIGVGVIDKVLREIWIGFWRNQLHALVPSLCFIFCILKICLYLPSLIVFQNMANNVIYRSPCLCVLLSHQRFFFVKRALADGPGPGQTGPE